MEAHILTLELKEKHWAVTIRCPFCGSIHKHGGGNVSERPTLGHRSAHCSRGEYAMVMNENSKVKGLPANYFLRM